MCALGCCVLGEEGERTKEQTLLVLGRTGKTSTVARFVLKILKVSRCFEVKSGLNHQEASYVLWTSSPTFECWEFVALDRHVGF